MIYRFGPFELDEEAGELRRGGQPVPVQPKPLALLALLIRDRDRVVSQDELFEALWPGTAVTPGSLTRAVSHARRAAGCEPNSRARCSNVTADEAQRVRRLNAEVAQRMHSIKLPTRVRRAI